MDASNSIWDHCLEHAALSDVGLRRANNQDSFAVALAGSQDDFQRRGHLFMVADGMGAHAAGELASKMAVDLVPLVYRKRLDQSPPEAILSAVLDANRQIHTRGQASPDFRGMGTTATILLLLPSGAMVAHVGDSRAYRLRGDTIEQLTFDHSLVWELRAAEKNKNAKLPGYISRNIITRSLGPNASVQVDLEGPHSVQAGDTFLLCSDGLSGQVSDDEIGLVLRCLPPADAARALADLAILRGGPDNITTVVVRVLGPQNAAASVSGPSQKNAAPVRPVHPVFWTAVGVAALAALGLLGMGHAWPALAAGAAALIAGLVALFWRYGRPDHEFQMAGRRFGRGPYVVCPCAANADLLARLTDLVQQLRQAAVNENWPVDWTKYEQFLAKTAAATQNDNPAEAAREHLQAMIFLMRHVREQQSSGGDSGVLLL